jgi:hypothetical protein
MPDRPELPTQEDLYKLPSRAIVAYAVRCARRVQPLFSLAEGRMKDLERRQAAVEGALRSAERFCVTEDLADTIAADAVAAYAAASFAAEAVAAFTAAYVAYAAAVANTADTADFAAESAAEVAAAAEAAADAKTVATEAKFAAARADYDRLVSLGLGTYPELGQPIDPGESGPLGPYWPEWPPEWLRKVVGGTTQPDEGR